MSTTTRLADAKSLEDRARDLVMLEAMGAGFTWGACLVRW